MFCKNLFNHETPVPVRPLVWIGIQGVVVRPNLQRMLHYYSLNVADVLRTSWKPVETLRSHWGFRCPCEAPRHKRPFRFLDAIIKKKTSSRLWRTFEICEDFSDWCAILKHEWNCFLFCCRVPKCVVPSTQLEWEVWSAQSGQPVSVLTAPTELWIRNIDIWV